MSAKDDKASPLEGHWVLPQVGPAVRSLHHTCLRHRSSRL